MWLTGSGACEAGVALHYELERGRLRARDPYGVDDNRGNKLMAQTKLGSFVEAILNIIVGFAINWCANMTILPLFGFKVSAGGAFEIGLIFTVISLVRSYVLRRWFNGLKFGNAEVAK
jgi:hypothetical protein